MRIALFGGTFDPIHQGHLILARDAVEQLGAERVLFIPAALSPHKLHRLPSPAKVRLAMVRAAIAGEPRFGLEESEVSREGPSYTVETVEAIRKREPGSELLYLIGEDNVPTLETWHRIADLRRHVEFVVFGRGCGAPSHGLRTLARRLDLSSTEIRERVARCTSIRYMVPETVCALIEQNRLYLPQTSGLPEAGAPLRRLRGG